MIDSFHQHTDSIRIIRSRITFPTRNAVLLDEGDLRNGGI